MSCKLIEHIIDTGHIDTIPAEDVAAVQGLIRAGHGAGGGGAAPGRRWLADIVANGRNGIDVDKFDYLARDSLQCGVKVSCDFNRLMCFTKARAGAANSVLGSEGQGSGSQGDAAMLTSSAPRAVEPSLHL